MADYRDAKVYPAAHASGQLPQTDYPSSGPLFNPGDRVRLVDTRDPYTRLERGATGTVTSLREHDGDRTVGVKWDDGSTLSMLIDEGDQIERIS